MAIVGMVAAVVGVVCSSDRGVAIMIVTVMGVTTAAVVAGPGPCNSHNHTAKPAEAIMVITVAEPGKLVVTMLELG